MKRQALLATTLLLSIYSCIPANHSNLQKPKVITSDIINGTPAAIGEFPEVVGLQTSGAIFCSGILIAPTTVLTAAHCLQGLDASEVTAIFGNSNGENSSSISALELKKYDRYFKGRMGVRSSQASGDLGIVELTHAPEHAQLAILPTGPFDLSELESTQALVVGFGAREANPNTTSIGEKYYVQVSRKTFRPGEMIFGNENPRQGGCHGDSGGPLFQFHPIKKQWVLTGIVGRPLNSAVPCTGSLGVATEIWFFSSWVNSFLQDQNKTDQQRQSESSQLIEKIMGQSTNADVLDLSGFYGLDVHALDYLPVLESVHLAGSGISTLANFERAKHWAINPFELDENARLQLAEAISSQHDIQFPMGTLVEAAMRQDQLIQTLSEANSADFFSQDEAGNLALHWAAINSDRELFELYQLSGIDLFTANVSGINALMLATDSWIQEQLLTSASLAQLNAMTVNGQSIFHFAVDHHDIALVKNLLTLGANPELFGPEASSPYEYALLKGCDEIAEILSSHLGP